MVGITCVTHVLSWLLGGVGPSEIPFIAAGIQQHTREAFDQLHSLEIPLRLCPYVFKTGGLVDNYT